MIEKTIKNPNILIGKTVLSIVQLNLATLIDKQTLIKPKMYLRVTIDVPISYEEASFIKETFINHYNCREISLIPQKSLEEISTQLDIQQV